MLDRGHGMHSLNDSIRRLSKQCRFFRPESFIMIMQLQEPRSVQTRSNGKGCETLQQNLNLVTHGIWNLPGVSRLPTITFYLCYHGICHHDKYLSISWSRMTMFITHGASWPGTVVANSGCIASPILPVAILLVLVYFSSKYENVFAHWPAVMATLEWRLLRSLVRAVSPLLSQQN